MPVLSLYVIGATVSALLCGAALIGPGRRTSVRATFALSTAVGAITAAGYYLYWTGFSGQSLAGLHPATLGLLGNTLYALGSGLYPPSMALFAVAYLRRTQLPSWVWSLAVIIGLGRAFIRVTNPWFHLISDFDLTHALMPQGVTLLGRVDNVFDYVIGGAAVALIVYAAWRSPSAFGRRQAFLVGAAGFTSLVAISYTADVRWATQAPYPDLGVASAWLLYLALASELFRLGLTDPLLTSLVPLIDRLSDGVVVLDGDGRVIAFNETATHEIPTLAEGAESLDALPGIGAAQVWPEGDREYETSLGDRTLWMRAIRMPARSANPGGLVALVTDITERRAAQTRMAELNDALAERLVQLDAARRLAEEQSQALEDVNERLVEYQQNKDRFLANVSHELRTPLNSVIGFSSILLQGLAGQLNSEQHRQLIIVQDAGKHLLRVVNDLLDLSRIAAGRVRIEPAATDVCAIVAEVVDTLAPLAAEKSIRVTADLPGPVIAETDPVRFRQVAMNLVANAVAYTEKGGVDVLVHDISGNVVVEVKDSGPGIPPERLAGIFDRFTRAPEQGSASGTGLGLSISRELVTVLGGTIEVDSKVGSGSVFRVQIPKRFPGQGGQ